MIERFVTFPELRSAHGIPYSRMHLDRLIKAGRFPRKIRLSHRQVVWVEAEIVAWQQAQIDGRDAGAVAGELGRAAGLVDRQAARITPEVVKQFNGILRLADAAGDEEATRDD